MKCQHILGDLEIVSEEEQMTTRCKKCGKVFHDTKEKFEIIKKWINVRNSAEKLLELAQKKK